MNNGEQSQFNAIINNLSKNMCKYNKIFRGSDVLKVSSKQIKKQESRRRFNIFKIFGVNFLKTKNFGMARLCLKATNSYIKRMVFPAERLSSPAAAHSKRLITLVPDKK